MTGAMQQLSIEYLQIWSDGTYDLIDKFYSSESWEYFDTGGMLMQLGMMPMDTGNGERR